MLHCFLLLNTFLLYYPLSVDPITAFVPPLCKNYSDEQTISRELINEVVLSIIRLRVRKSGLTCMCRFNRSSLILFSNRFSLS